MAQNYISIADPNVLIDYRDSCVSLLRLISLRVTRLRVVRQALPLVQISDQQCATLAIEIIDPETLVLMEASQLSFTIGFEENVCFLISRTLRCTCITNDPALTRYCVAGGIKVLSGLDLLVCLVQCGSLAREKASVVARLMHESNPAHLTSDIINRFDCQLIG
jgi:hypothetical protein